MLHLQLDKSYTVFQYPQSPTKSQEESPRLHIHITGSPRQNASTGSPTVTPWFVVKLKGTEHRASPGPHVCSLVNPLLIVFFGEKNRPQLKVLYIYTYINPSLKRFENPITRWKNWGWTGLMRGVSKFWKTSMWSLTFIKQKKTNQPRWHLEQIPTNQKKSSTLQGKYT